MIAGERRGHEVLRILEELRATYGETEMGLSVVTILELEHGVQRAKDDERCRRRQAFVDELVRDMPIHPVSLKIARLAGRIEGEQAGKGITIAFGDLLIGATALSLGHGVVTDNVRHFRMIPGLVVVPLSA